MKESLEKLDSYQILTNLLPGGFFGLGLGYLFNIRIPTEGIVDDVIVYYFIGLIISRIGSLVLEPCLKKMNLIEYTSYSEFISAEKGDAKIPVLLTVSNYTRSLLTCMILFLAVWLLRAIAFRWEWFGSHWKGMAAIALTLLFFASYKKQTNFIYKRVIKQKEEVSNCSKAEKPNSQK